MYVNREKWVREFWFFLFSLFLALFFLYLTTHKRPPLTLSVAAGFVLLGFVVLGLFRDPWEPARARQEAFLAVTCIPFLVFLTFHSWPRYLLPMTAVLLLWVRGGGPDGGMEISTTLC